MLKPNLLVSYDPARFMSAKQEVEDVLKRVKRKPKFLKGNVPGVFELKVSNPKETVKSLRRICMRKPERFMRTYRWVPIDKWAKTNVREMQKEIKKFSRKISKTESWKMELRKRKNKKFKNSVNLILKLTDVIDRPKVNLKNPKKIVNVEILGGRAGLSLLRYNEYFSSAKIRK